MKSNEFTLAEVLGGMTGYLLEDGGFSRLHKLIEVVMDQPIFTHQFRAIAVEVKNGLADQFPKLDNPKVYKEVKRLAKNIKSEHKTNEICRWNKLIAKYGNSFEVIPMVSREVPLSEGLPEKKIILLNVKTDKDEFPQEI